MKTIIKSMILIGVLGLVGCIKETMPQQDVATSEQVAQSPGVFNTFVNTCTSSLVGQFTYSGSNMYPWDYGYPSFFLQRDVMGQDIVIDEQDWHTDWYAVGTGLGPRYAVCQLPWTYYYKWINNCNVVLSMAGENPVEEHKHGAGIALAMRAMFYMDLARMYQSTYKGNEDKVTVPIVTEKPVDYTNNPRATNTAIWTFILSDLDRAEALLEDYTRSDVYTPDVKVVYGLKARAYLTMENFEQAEFYAKKAQEGFSPLTKDEYLDKMTAFNTPNHAWIYGLTFKSDDPNILLNDSDSNWGSQMFLEVQDVLYASNYGQPKRIDAHLYETIPETDFRKQCYIDFAIDQMDLESAIEAISAYSDYPERIIASANATTSGAVGGLQLKFRAGGGVDGREGNAFAATCVAVPMMRVEEMMLIEAEAAGMQDEARGKQLLEAFATLRDPSYEYNADVSFRDNVWWQRRVELWGEGFATFDIKRLNKGIVRSYAGTNHYQGARFNTDSAPYWTNLCIVGTEADYNKGILENNPTPLAPGADSPEHVW